jgi:D-arabinose 1-dehydrogenase-like Zn-dependent alcohol dehydrogenase
MKALVYTEPGKLVYRDEPDPAPEAGEALIQVDSVGICGSDLHAYRGHDERRLPPLILGHEVSGLAQPGSARSRRGRNQSPADAIRLSFDESLFVKESIQRLSPLVDLS